MKKCLVVVVAGVMCFSGISFAESAPADTVLEMALLIKFAEDVGLGDYELVELLGGYREYRSTMDGYLKQRCEKVAALNDAIAKNEGSPVLMGLTRDIMNIDMNIMRLKQSSVNEAAALLGAKSVAQLYLLVSDMEAAKANLLAELSGKAEQPTAVIEKAEKAAPEAAPAPAEEKPEKLILDQAMHFLNKLAAKDLDTAMSAVSEKFKHPEYGEKAELKSFLDQAILMGYLDDIKIITDETEVKIEGDKAVIYPIDIEGVFGSFTLELTCAKEDGKWLVVGMDVFGL